ncbi:MAG TPA: Na/Pi cotransporter family protein [Syntrophomonadaceae bacterium]|nr:Na/Pi cotransporter family protein [Syntrophomonadaceae bacterium]HRX21461.1 Na/Pi cotransporter family protein [Syntrophomonadaceae bacterium]
MVDYQAMTFAFLGGLALLMFGLKFMSSALQEVAGDKMRTILEKGTKNPIRGALTGMAATALIQSSTATTILTVGLVNSRLLTLKQAIGVIMGANIGTTVTVYLIGFNLGDYALPIIAAGVITYIFVDNKKAQLIGQAITGIGLLFFGLTILGDGLAPLKDVPVFANLMLSIEDNAILGVLVGAIFTATVHSSSATIGVLQELAYQGAITYHQAVPILCGDNIGTTVTALLVAIGTGVVAKRAALTHFMFNFIGSCLFLPLFVSGIAEKAIIFFTNYLLILIPGSVSWDMLNIKLQIAQTHLFFNLSNTLIQLPFVAVLAYIVTKIIPDSKKDTEDEMKTIYIDKRFLANPSVALSQATRETLRMGDITVEAFTNAMGYFVKREKHQRKKGEQLEEFINHMEREITDYIVLASESRLSKEDSYQSFALLQCINDTESIADICMNIIELADYADRHQVSFSGEALEELEQMVELTKNTLNLTMQVARRRDPAAAEQVKRNEEKLDELQREYRRNHIRRLNEHICNGNNGAVFLDILGNLERISDLCRNIAGYAIGESA